ncbi:hypothetical protein C8R46DRAFT_41068 [Mycena filopes]|nr:hypothetical protein C8R46DRAFT_41068 [Mycena filopes]
MSFSMACLFVSISSITITPSFPNGNLNRDSRDARDSAAFEPPQFLSQAVQHSSSESSLTSTQVEIISSGHFLTGAEDPPIWPES